MLKERTFVSHILVHPIGAIKILYIIFFHKSPQNCYGANSTVIQYPQNDLRWEKNNIKILINDEMSVGKQPINRQLQPI